MKDEKYTLLFSHPLLGHLMDHRLFAWSQHKSALRHC